jgi:cysteine desulfurase/selenocysteine lyase
MTTSQSTSNPMAVDTFQSAEATGLPQGLPGIDALTRLANELFATVPGGGSHSFLNAAPSSPAHPMAADLPNEEDLRKIPAGLSGVSGQSPVSFIQSPNLSDTDAGFYFLKTIQTSSPGTVPVLRPDKSGLDPTLSSALPAGISSAGSSFSPVHGGLPGSRLGSSATHTPGIELGSQPFTGAAPPASAIGVPDETLLRSLAPPGGAAVASSQNEPGATASVYYFLAAANQPAPRTPTTLELEPRQVEFDNLPALGLGLNRAVERHLSVPSSNTATSFGAIPGSIEPAGSVASGEAVAGLSLYFLDELTATSGYPAAPLNSRANPELAPLPPSAHPGFDVHAVRRDFPILAEEVHGKPLIWFDNAATTQKPQAVIDRIGYFYTHENSNIHRAAHELAARATDAYEGARQKVRQFLNASSSEEIVFVRGTTEAINLIAKSWGRRNIGKDDEVVISWLEHHANIVPWQQLCAETGARLRVAPVDDDGQILLDEYEKLLGPRTRLVSLTQVSNALGTVTPIKQMVEIAHRHGARVLVDGAQAVSHMAVDVQSLDCDWYVFSGHKVFGPTGIGAVYGKLDLLNATPPWQGGGNMIQDVTFEKTIYHPAPARFEAGTGNIADAVGLGAALDYVLRLGMENIARYEHDLLVYAMDCLKTVPGIRLIGTAPDKASVLSFVLPGFRTEAIGEVLNRDGIAVRSGHHCAQPILRRFGLETTVRPSLAFYNTHDEVDALVRALHRIQGGSHALRR